MKLHRNAIVVFNIDRERYGLKPLRDTDCVNCIGVIQWLYKNHVRVKFTDVFSYCSEETITINKNRIIEVI